MYLSSENYWRMRSIEMRASVEKEEARNTGTRFIVLTLSHFEGIALFAN